MSKTIRVFMFAFAIALVPSCLFAESPIQQKEVEKRLKMYVYQTEKSNVTKIELVDGTMKQIQRGLRVYPLYQQPVVFYWEGTYGQVVKDSVYFEFIKAENVWIYQRTIPGLPDATVIVKEPTKPLPQPPAEPGKIEVKKVLDRYVPESSVRISYTYEILSLSQPEFKWTGFDYQDGVYIYKGRTRFVKKERGEGGGLLSMRGSSEKWEADFVATMTYVKGKQLSDIDRRFMGDISSGWTGDVNMDLQNAKRIK